MSKRTLKTLLGLIKESQRHTIAETLYYIEDAHSSKEEARRVEGGPSGSPQGRPSRSLLDKRKKSVLNDTLP